MVLIHQNRLFISSTFEDMQAERNYLVKSVIPRLRAQCEQRRIHLIEVDLRWGVTEEESKSGRAVEICLNEVDNCDIFAALVGLYILQFGCEWWCLVSDII